MSQKNLEGKLFVVKAGGDVLDSSYAIIGDVKALSDYGAKVVFVYGAQAELNKRMEQLGMVPEFVNGLRVTSAEFMERIYIPVMSERGKAIPSQIPDSGLFIAGVCAEKLDWKLGYVGEAVHVDRKVKDFLENGKVAVLSPLAKSNKCWEGFGIEGYLNCNADNVAARLAVYFKPEAFYMATNVDGVLIDGSAKSYLTAEDAKDLVSSGKISGGMMQKVNNAVLAAEKGINAVIFNGLKGSLLDAIEGKTGTRIYNPAICA